LTANAELTIVLGSIPASTETVESVLNKVHKKNFGAAYPYGAMNFHRHVGHTRRRRVNFSKNLRA
jgi:hypothetical protein